MMNQNRAKILDVLYKSKNEKKWSKRYLIIPEISELCNIPYSTVRYHVKKLALERKIEVLKQGPQYLYYIE